jgi:hypothetical protein
MAITKKLVLLSMAVLILSCTKVEKIYLLPERAEIVEAIHSKIVNDGVFSIDGLNDANAYSLEYSSSSLEKALFPDTLEKDFSKIKIGRNISQVIDTTILYDIKWDSAYIDVKYTLRGSLKIVTLDDSTHYITTTKQDTNYINDTTYVVTTEIDTVGTTVMSFPVDSIAKSFTHSTSQKAIFLRTQNTDNAAKDWKLAKITPIIFESTQDNLFIKKVSVNISGTSSNVTIPEEADTDPILTYLDRDSLPLINYNNAVTINAVEIENDDPYPEEPGELVMVHFGLGVDIYKIRKPLSDINDTGSHSGSFNVTSHGKKIYRLFIDLIDYRTILTATGAYSAQVWMIPFQVP